MRWISITEAQKLISAHNSEVAKFEARMNKERRHF
jgi:hypothetical protein